MRDESALRPIVVLWNELRIKGGSSESVYATLREAILSKVLLPDQEFTEEGIAHALGVSRTPVREAVLRLGAEHLVARTGRRLAVPGISPVEVLEIYDVRIALDALAAELAAHNATPPGIAQLRWLNEQMTTAGEGGDFDRMSTLNLEFHDWLAQISGNWFLLTQVRVVHDRVRRFDRSTFEVGGRWQKAVAEHERILDAIASGDGKAAGEAAAVHMSKARQSRLAMVQADDEAVGQPATRSEGTHARRSGP